MRYANSNFLWKTKSAVTDRKDGSRHVFKRDFIFLNVHKFASWKCLSGINKKNDATRPDSIRLVFFFLFLLSGNINFLISFQWSPVRSSFASKIMTLHIWSLCNSKNVSCKVWIIVFDIVARANDNFTTRLETRCCFTYLGKKVKKKWMVSFLRFKFIIIYFYIGFTAFLSGNRPEKEKNVRFCRNHLACSSNTRTW